MKTKHPFFAPCKEVWLSYYQQMKGESYYWTAKDSVHLHQLIKKIESKLTSRSMEINVDNIVNSTKAFFSSITDKWHLENLELCKVNSNFNSLYAAAVRKSPIGSASEIDEVLARRNREKTRGGFGFGDIQDAG